MRMDRRSQVLLALLAVLLVAVAWLANGLGLGDSVVLDANNEVVAAPQAGEALPSTESVVGGAGVDGAREAVELDSEPLVGAEVAAEDVQEAVAPAVFGTVLRPGGVPVADAVVVIRPMIRWARGPADAEMSAAMVGTLGSLDRHETRTDVDGRFEFSGVDKGLYALAIRARGLAPLRRPGLSIPEHDEHDLGQFELELGVMLSGRVVGPRGAGLEGVQVLAAVSEAGGFPRFQLPGRGIPVAVTDPDGRFEVGSLVPGSWHLLFDAPGHRPQELRGVTEPAGASDRSLLVRLERGAEVQGRVIGYESLEAAGLRVVARITKEQATGATEGLAEVERRRGRWAELEPDGTFRVGGLVPGARYRLKLEQLEPEEEGRSRGWVAVERAQHADAQAGDRGVELEIGELSGLRFVVRSAGSGAPVELLRPLLSGKGIERREDSDSEDAPPMVSYPGGRVELEDLRLRGKGQPVTLRLLAPGHLALERTGLQLVRGEVLDLGELELELAPLGRVLVVDDRTGQPLEGAEVVVTTAERREDLSDVEFRDRVAIRRVPHFSTATTGETGEARPTLWDRGVLHARALAAGYLPGEEATLRPPYEAPVEMRLVRAGEVSVRVVDPSGAPAPGMIVRRAQGEGEPTILSGIRIESESHRSGFHQAARSDEDGRVVFGGLAPGRQVFVVVDRLSPWGGTEGGTEEARGELVVATGGRGELVLRIEPRGSLSVTVERGGEPFPGALVRLEPPEGEGRSMFWGAGNNDPRSGITDHLGRIRFESTRVGLWRLRISHPSRYQPVLREVQLREGERSLRVEVGQASIAGRLLDGEGRPVRGVAIQVEAPQVEGLRSSRGDYRVRISEDEDGDTDFDWEQLSPGTPRSGADGRFEVRGVLPEEELVLRLSGRYIIPRKISLEPLGLDERWGPTDLVVERTGAMRVHLTGVEGRLRDSYRARLVMEGELGVREQRFRRWRGHLRLDSVPAGKHTLELLEKGIDQPLSSVQVEVLVGESLSVTVRP